MGTLAITALVVYKRSHRLASSPDGATRRFSDDFVDHPTDDDLHLLLQLAEEYRATATPTEVALTQVEAFLDAYELALEHGRGQDFVAGVKSLAAEAASGVRPDAQAAEARAEAYLEAAYDAYDATHLGSLEKSYTTQELIEVLTLACSYAIADGQQDAADVIKGALIHVYSAVRTAGN